MGLSRKSGITKLSSASVQPHGSGRPSPKSPSPFWRWGLFKPFSCQEKGWDEVETKEYFVICCF